VRINVRQREKWRNCKKEVERGRKLLSLIETLMEKEKAKRSVVQSFLLE